MATKFNASQDKVVVTANNQGNAYEEVLRKYQAASSKPSQLPQVIYLEDTALGEMVDKGQVLPAEAGIDFDISAIDNAALVPGGAPFPGIESPGKVFASGGAFYILNTGTPAQQAASWKFLQFMLQPENAMEWHTSGGYLPVVKSVLEEDSVTTFWETDVAGVLLLNAVDQLRAADPDQSGPLIGPFPTYTEAIQGALEGVLFSGTDAAAALDTAEAAVNETLTDYNGG